MFHDAMVKSSKLEEIEVSGNIWVMGKYRLVFTNTLQKAFIYRARNVIHSLINTAPMIVMISIWGKYYAEGKSVGGYLYSELLAYYLVGIAIALWSSRIHENVKDDIKDGELSNYVIKPFDYFWFRLFWELGWHAAKFMMLVVPLMLAFIVSGVAWQLHINFLSILAVILAYLLSFFMSMIVGLSAFYVTETTGITNIYSMIMELFTGKVFPVIFFPLAIQKILEFLPFKYLAFFPIQLFVRSTDTKVALVGIGIQMFWILVMYFVARKTWRNGVSKFSGVGL